MTTRCAGSWRGYSGGTTLAWWSSPCAHSRSLWTIARRSYCAARATWCRSRGPCIAGRWGRTSRSSSATLGALRAPRRCDRQRAAPAAWLHSRRRSAARCACACAVCRTIPGARGEAPWRGRRAVRPLHRPARRSASADHPAGAVGRATARPSRRRAGEDHRRVRSRRDRCAGRPTRWLHRTRSRVGAQARRDVIRRDRESDAAAGRDPHVAQHELRGGPARDVPGVAGAVARSPEAAAGDALGPREH